MSGDKWTTVGRKEQHKSKKDHTHPTASGVAVETSSSVFSRYGDQEEERRNPQRKTPPDQPPVATETTQVRKRVKKPLKNVEKVYKTFEECAAQLSSEETVGRLQRAQENSTDAQHLLKEVLGLLQMTFSDLRQEDDFAFTKHPPGYPLSALAPRSRERLLAVVGSCPPLAQEAVFRYCVDRLLGDVRAQLPSHGTRAMIQLLTDCNPSSCSEATQRISLLLQSCLSKVPEALSLLWAGLPHPQTHPLVFLGAWPVLCLPVLASTANVPRSVTVLLLAWTEDMLKMIQGPALLEALSPRDLCTLLTSPQLLSKKSHDQLLSLAGGAVIQSCSDTDCARYFREALITLPTTSQAQHILGFAMHCLLESPASCDVWLQTGPAHPQASALLLQALSSSAAQPDRNHSLATTLHSLRGRLVAGEQRKLCNSLVDKFGGVSPPAEGEEEESAAGEGACFSVSLWLAVGLYLCVLALLLSTVAQQGPGWNHEELYSAMERAVLAGCSIMWRVLAVPAQLALDLARLF